ncbi:MAG TPA: DnaJ domain-containing protein [Candidatus Kapabacteria bacterium]|nr:DnaJ domain-containing protein [Candidatus Kapabacteria bacterium]
MGQIFDRISRIVKSEKSKSSNDYIHNNFEYHLNEDDELKNIIDNLNQSSNSNNYSNQQSYTNDNGVEKAYELFNLTHKASIDEIKNAYKSRIKEYHPDKTSGLGEDLQKLAQIKTQELNAAYSLLKKVRNF